MRLTLSLGIVLLLLVPTLASAHYNHGVGDAFALVRTQGEEGPTLQAAGLFLVAEVPEGYLAFVDPHELNHLRGVGHSVEVLVARDDNSLAYFIAFDSESDHGHRLADPPLASDTLYHGEHYRVMALPLAQADEIQSCVLEIQRIHRRPLSFPRRPWADKPAAERDRATDPAIVTALADITQPPLETQVQHLEDYGTRHSEYSAGNQASIWIRDQFLSFGYSDVTFHDYNSWNDNVVCVKPGAVFPDEVVVIGAHYDTIAYPASVAPGADDNASGTVAVLEAARVLKDVEFERTLIFIAFSGEEEGLVGADAWSADAAAADMNIIGMLNLDMICYLAGGDTEDLDIITNSASQPFADLAYATIADYVPDLTAVEGYLTGGSSDHAAFWGNGYRAIFFFEDSGNYSPYLHTANDLIGISANNFPFMLKNVRAATATVAELARPFHVSIAHSALEHSEGTGPFEVLAEIRSAEPLDLSSLELQYRSGGGPLNTLALTPTGQADEYGAQIPAQAPGTLVEYFLSAADMSGYSTSNPVGAPVDLHAFRTGVSLVLVEDCEADLGWTLGAPGDNASTGIWIRADPVGTSYQPEDDHSADPGTICFVTGNANPGDSAGANDVDDGHTTLISPIFDLDEASWASISYWRWYTDGTNNDDTFRVDISNDAGGSWSELETVTASAYPWMKVEFEDLGSRITLTDQMQLRFIAEDIGSGSLVEALIDDLRIVATGGDLTAVETTPALAARLDAYPNPFNPKTTLRMSLSQAGLAELKVYDASGAQVAMPFSGAATAGELQLSWDASALPSGLYFARLSVDGNLMDSQKLVLLK
jgi:hypothetical protein